jgi:NADH-quinone oxidoreductase subunit L
VPLILLAIPSVYTGWTYIEPLLFGDYFAGSIVVKPDHNVLAELGRDWHGVGAFMLHGLTRRRSGSRSPASPPPGTATSSTRRCPRGSGDGGPVYTLLDNKYYFDKFNDWFFAGGARKVGGWRPRSATARSSTASSSTARRSSSASRRRCCATSSRATSTTTRSR